MLILTHQQQAAFEKTLWEKEKIACNEQFLLFPQCFLLNQILVSTLVHIFEIILFTAELEEPKIGSSAKGLTHYPDREGMKTLREKQKMLVTSKFLFSQNMMFSIL